MAQRAGGLLGVAACVVALALAGCGGGDDNDSGGGSAEESPSSIRIAVPPATLVSVKPWIADKLGLWKKAGLTPVYVSASSGTSLAQVVATDNADLTLLDVNGAAAGLAAKIFDPVFVAGDTRRPLIQIQCQPGLVPKGLSNEELMKRLAELKVGVPGPGSGTDIIYRTELRQAGAPAQDDNIIAVGTTANMIAALQSKSVDCIAGTMPVSIILGDKAETVVDYLGGEGSKSFSEDYQYTGWVFSRDRADKLPDFAKKVSGVLEEANAYLADPANAKEAAKLLIEYFPGLDQADLETSLRQVAPNYTYGLTEAEMANGLEIYNALHEDKPVEVDPASLIFTPLKETLQKAAEADPPDAE